MERAELETMADQLRGLSCPSGRAESVNLDNLFDFLADVPAQRGAPDGQPAHQPTIAEIGDSMERLADDLHQEVTEIERYCNSNKIQHHHQLYVSTKGLGAHPKKRVTRL